MFFMRIRIFHGARSRLGTSRRGQRGFHLSNARYGGDNKFAPLDLRGNLTIRDCLLTHFLERRFALRTLRSFFTPEVGRLFLAVGRNVGDSLRMRRIFYGRWHNDTIVGLFLYCCFEPSGDRCRLFKISEVLMLARRSCYYIVQNLYLCWKLQKKNWTNPKKMTI